jgi:hypothetical protein
MSGLGKLQRSTLSGLTGCNGPFERAAPRDGFIVVQRRRHPAAIKTPMWELTGGEGSDRANLEAAMVRDTPSRRCGKAAEVAALAVVLAFD